MIGGRKEGSFSTTQSTEESEDLQMRRTEGFQIGRDLWNKSEDPFVGVLNLGDVRREKVSGLGIH